MKRHLRFPYSKTCTPPLFPYLLQHFSLNFRSLSPRVSSSPTSSFHKPLAIIKRYPFFFIYGILNTFYRLHHPISVLCILCGLFSLSLHCARVSSGFSAFFCIFLCFRFFFFIAFASPPPSTIAFSFSSPSSCLSLVPHSFFSFSIVATEQWLAQKPLRVSPPLLVHSLPQVHHHRLRRAHPPQRVRSPKRRLLHIPTRGCTSGLPSTCSLRPLRNSLTTTSPTF